jgi:hypothetical protein
MKVLVPIDLKNGKHNNSQTNVSSTSPASVYLENHADFRSAKFFIQTSIDDGVSVEHVVREILAVHDGTNAYLTEYAVVSTDEASDAMDDVFSADVSGAFFVLNITPSTSDARSITVNSVSFRDSGL